MYFITWDPLLDERLYKSSLPLTPDIRLNSRRVFIVTGYLLVSLSLPIFLSVGLSVSTKDSKRRQDISVAFVT